MNGLRNGVGSGSRRVIAQAVKAFNGGFERFAPPREMKAQPLTAGRGISVETRARHRRDAAIGHQMVGEADVIVEAET